jgi:hypothetical protein
MACGGGRGTTRGEPLSILIKYKTIDTPKIESILKIYFKK